MQRYHEVRSGRLASNTDNVATGRLNARRVQVTEKRNWNGVENFWGCSIRSECCRLLRKASRTSMHVAIMGHGTLGMSYEYISQIGSSNCVAASLK